MNSDLEIKNNSLAFLSIKSILKKIKSNNGLYFVYSQTNGFSYNKLEELMDMGLLESMDMSYMTWYFKRKLIKFYKVVKF